MKSHIYGSTSAAPSTSATNYNSINGVGSASWNATETNRGTVIPHAMTVDQLRVRVSTATPPGSGKSWAFTLVVNGTPSALTCTVADTNVAAQDLTHSVSLSAGDYVSIQITPSGTPAVPAMFFWSLRQDATDLFGVLGSNVGAPTTGTNYMPPQNRAVVGSTDALAQIIVPTAGVLKNLYVWAKAAPASGKSWAFTVVKNGVDQSLAATIANTATAANDTSNTVSVSAGDTISIKIVASGTPTSQPISYSLSFDPTVDGESFVAFNGNGIGPSTSATQYNQPAGGDLGWNATEANRFLKFGACTVKGIYAATSVSPGASPRAYTFTARQAGADTTAAVTINDASTAVGSTRVGGTVGQSISIADDDMMAIKSVPGGSPIGLFAKTSLLLYITPGSGAQSVTLPLVSSTASVYTPTVTRGAVTVSLPTITSTISLHAPMLSHRVVLPHIASTTSMNSPSITVGAVSLSLPHVSSANVLYVPVVSAASPTVTLPFISASSILYAPSLAQRLSLPHITSTTTLHSPSVAPGGVSLSLPTISSTTSLYGMTLGQSISLPKINSAITLHNPTVLPGAISLTLPKINSTTTLYAPSTAAVTPVVLPHIASTATLHTPSLKQKVTLPFITSTTQLYGGSVANYNQVILLPYISDGKRGFPTIITIQGKVLKQVGKSNVYMEL